MSYPPQQPYPPPYVNPAIQQMPPAGWPPPAPPPRPPRNWILPVALGLGGVLFLIGVAVATNEATQPKPEPAVTKATAERVCRTEFGREGQERAKNAQDDDVVVAIQSIEMLETVKTDTGWTVNGTVHFTIATGLTAPIANMVDLTCEVSGTDANPATAIDNRD